MANLDVVVNEPPPLEVLIQEEDALVEVTLPPTAVAVEVSVPGPAGPQGPQGVSGDLHYRHVQAEASDTWIITHNLEKYPSVGVVDSALNLVEGDVQHNSLNQTTLRFSAPFSGEAYLN